MELSCISLHVCNSSFVTLATDQRMRYLFQLLYFVLVPVMAAASDGTVLIQGEMAPLNTSPTFDHGYLATYGLDGIAVYSRDGSLAMKIAHPAGGHFRNADIDSDGSVVAGMGRGGNRDGSIMVFNPDGAKVHEITTGSYQPSEACFAPDGSLWTLGDEHVRPESDPTADFLLRHYSREGTMLGGFLPRSSFPSDVYPGGPRIGGWRIRIAAGRIGVKLTGAGVHKQMLWLEADLEGKEIGRWTAPRGGEPLAFTASGAVYAQVGTEITLLDHASGTWKPLTVAVAGRLQGAEGDTLVSSIPGNAILRTTLY
jgi:hypothetical protein